MGKFIEDRYEAEFTLDAPVEEVWDALERENEREAVWLSAFPRLGSEITAELIEKKPPYQVRMNKVAEPCKGTEIAVTLESVDNGTRVLVVQSGFPAYVKSALETFRIGGDQIIADLALYLTRGIEMSRHAMPWAFSGISAREVDTGLEVTAVVPGCFGERVGLQQGDLLMTLNGAPLFTQHCLQALLRVFKPGDEIGAQWVRGKELQQGHAAL